MAAGNFGFTHHSGMSVGFDPAEGDLAPRDRKTGAWFSVGTRGEVVVSQNSVQVAANASGQFTAGSAGEIYAAASVVSLSNTTLKTAMVGTSGTPIQGIYSSVVSVNPASMAAGSTSTLTVALSGAATDSCIIAHPISSLWSGEYTRLNYVAYCDAAGSVEIAFSNTTGATIDAAELNWRVTAIDF